VGASVGVHVCVLVHAASASMCLAVEADGSQHSTPELQRGAAGGASLQALMAGW